MRLNARFLIALVLLASTALFLQARGRSEVFPPRLPLASFPEQVGNWSGTDVEIPKDVREVLGPGDFLLRIYRSDDESKPFTDLFIAYFPTQRAGDTIHSPKNCLPGAGWTPIDSRRPGAPEKSETLFPPRRVTQTGWRTSTRLSKGSSEQYKDRSPNAKN